MTKIRTAVALMVLGALVSAASADTIYGTERGQLWQIDTTTVTATAVGPGWGGWLAEAIAIKPGGGTAAVLGQYGPNLYPMDVTTGVPGAALGGDAFEYQALAYAPDNQLWGFDDASGGDQLVSIDDTTGLKTNVGARQQRVNAMAFIGTTAYCWAEGAGLMTVNLTTGALTDVNGAEVGPIMSGMAVGPNDGVLYGAGPYNNDLYSINPATGVATLLGALPGVGGLEGLSSVEAPIPEPATRSLLALGGLGAMIRRRKK